MVINGMSDPLPVEIVRDPSNMVEVLVAGAASALIGGLVSLGVASLVVKRQGKA